MPCSSGAAETLRDARREFEICNACRYCEGFCGVFPAMMRRREFSDGELNYLVAMKGEYPEIGHAVRQWMALSLTIRTRDIRAVRAWVTRVEPLRERSRLLSKLAD